ncbi:hypothetical protein [Candidatus Enterococcus clewellii]|uniref:Uncharacterized protein n=1 Tax=Candidatus Enterococcus clewellii TaxID=1834193 RepID=A0A242K3G0_9ENTE|nr:hypothetical protein [Enterococcus sp. 9E7_DIV0242]OTP13441.1 hypothetical protein A5888_002919 [Enterococcus sp. 9E7_DIV0242]
MNCYLWELEAILEGLSLKSVDDREKLVELAFNLRYVMNAKKPKVSKVFKKDKEENRIKKAFRNIKEKAYDRERVDRIRESLEYFKKRR